MIVVHRLVVGRSWFGLVRRQRVSVVLCVLAGALLSASAPAFAASAPAVEESSILNVASGSATFSALINPEGESTVYDFEYGPTTAYGTSVPIPDGSVGAGGAALEVQAHVQDLQAHTTYHARVVAHNALGTTDGEDLTFTTQPGGGELALPDSRQWEMVTPPEKEGAKFFNEVGGEQAAASGDAIVLDSNTATEAEPPGNNPPNRVFLLATRGSSGWSSQNIMPPTQVPNGVDPYSTIGEYVLFSEDLSLGFVNYFGGPPSLLSPEATEATPFLRTLYEHGDVSEHCSSSCYEPLVTAADVTSPGTKFGAEGKALLEGATPDLSHVVIKSTVALTSTPIESGGTSGALYEWAGGQLQLVNVLPEAEGGGTPIAWLGSGPARDEGSDRNAISSDGSRVIWSTYTGGLYLREMPNPDLPKGETMKISNEARFEAASSDASRIFFVEGGEGTYRGVGGGDLDEYNLNAPAGSRLTKIAEGVSKVVGVGEDGSYLYYAAAPPECTGAMCLYEYHGGVVRLVAVLAEEDSPDWRYGLNHLTARVSPDGRWLAFQSSRDLTGYDTRDAVTGNPDEEVYLYNGETSKLVCASCNPTGARPIGAAYNEEEVEHGPAERWNEGQGVAAEISGWNYINGEVPPLYGPRYLSDGGRLFFDSHEALVPQDVNGTQDVYEYEPAEVGSCAVSSVAFSERSGGCVGLISSGTSAQESAFVDASETGGDVFFLTNASLAPQDVDTAGDVYDAHECTTLVPCYAPAPVTPPPCDTADSCKAAQSPQPPIFGAPSSETFSGAGNITPTPSVSAAKPKAKPAKCRRGFVKKKGACVRRPRSRGKKARVVKSSRGGRS